MSYARHVHDGCYACAARATEITTLEAKNAEQAKEIEGLERFRKLRIRHNDEMQRVVGENAEQAAEIERLKSESLADLIDTGGMIRVVQVDQVGEEVFVADYQPWLLPQCGYGAHHYGRGPTLAACLDDVREKITAPPQ